MTYLVSLRAVLIGILTSQYFQSKRSKDGIFSIMEQNIVIDACEKMQDEA